MWVFAHANEAERLLHKRVDQRRLVSSGVSVLSAQTIDDLHGKDSRVTTLTIEAATPESALALYQALAEFPAELRVSDDGRRFIDVELGGNLQIVAVLNAVEEYVTHRNDGPARVALDDRSYMLHPVE